MFSAAAWTKLLAAGVSKHLILIVDDEVMVRKTIGRMLEGHGYAVAYASDGKEALAYLGSEQRPDLILLDLRMPVMDGHEFLAALRAKRALRAIPVVAIHAQLEPRLPPGVEGLRKPFDAADLLAAITRSVAVRS